MSATKAILTDTTLCTGCEKCVEACKEEKGLGKDQPQRWKRRIDLYMGVDKQAALEWGRRPVTIRWLPPEGAEESR